MDESVFTNIIRQTAPLTEQVTLHLMGDPLVHPKLQKFLDICHDHQVKVFFVTNGVLMNELKEELLLHPALRQVNFSLHSFHDNYGDKDPSIYLEKIFRYSERALHERPELYLNFRLWNLQTPLGTGLRNQAMLERIEKHFNFKFVEPVDVRQEKSFRIRNRLNLHFDTEFTWPSVDLPLLGTRGTCYGLSSHFGILADGTVVPCCLDKEGKIPLGKVQETPLLEILDSEKAKKIFQGFRDNKLIESLCQRCQYITRFN